MSSLKKNTPPQTCRPSGPRWRVSVKVSPQHPSPPSTCTPESCTPPSSGETHLVLIQHLFWHLLCLLLILVLYIYVYISIWGILSATLTQPLTPYTCVLCLQADRNGPRVHHGPNRQHGSTRRPHPGRGDITVPPVHQPNSVTVHTLYSYISHHPAKGSCFVTEKLLS